MLEIINKALIFSKDLLQLFGVMIIIYKSFYSLYRYIITDFKKGETRHLRFYKFKFEVGHGIGAGLELIVAGDVISTTIDQDYSDLGRLAILVIIRTAIDFFLEKELETIPEKDRITIQNM